MPASGKKTGSGSGKKRKTTTRKSSSAPRKRTTSKKKQQEENGLKLEILVLIILGISILLMIGNFGMGGSVGEAVSQFSLDCWDGFNIFFPFFFFSVWLLLWQIGKIH